MEDTMFVAVFPLADLPPGRSAVVEVGEEEIALFNVKGEIFAIENACPHAGAALGRGDLCEESGTVACPWHGWSIDVRSGACRSDVATVRTFPVRIEGGEILVALEGEG